DSARRAGSRVCSRPAYNRDDSLNPETHGSRGTGRSAREDTQAAREADWRVDGRVRGAARDLDADGPPAAHRRSGVTDEDRRRVGVLPGKGDPLADVHR